MATPRHRLRLLPAVLAASAVLLAACSGGSESGSGTQEIDLGTISDLSGPASVIGLAGQQGQKLAEQIVNEDPTTYLGAANRTLSIAYADASNAPTQSVTVARQYIQEKKVVGILGPLYLAQAQAVAPITTQAQVPLLVPYVAGGDALTALGDYVFVSSQPDRRTVETAIGALRRQWPGDSVVGVLYGSDSAGNIQLATYAKEMLAAQGMTAVEFSVPYSSQDYSSAISTLQSRGVQAVYICTGSPAIGAAMQQAERSGFHPHWVGYSTMFDQSVITSGGSQANGALLTADYDPTLDTPLAREFRDRFQAAYGKPPNSWAALGFQSVMIAASAIGDIQGTVTGAALRDAMQQVKAPAIVGDGTFTFDANRDTSQPPAVLTVRDSQFQRAFPT